MSNLIPYEFNGQIIYGQVDEQGNDWFAVGDVREVLQLGYEVLARFADEEADDFKMSRHGGKLLGMINESGLYSLIFESTVPEALAFQRWFWREVLPAILQTGEYWMPPNRGSFYPVRLDGFSDVSQEGTP